MAKFKGLAVPFFTESENLGGFIEVIESGAIDISNDIRLLYQHDGDNILGRTSSGTLTLTEQSDGIYFECETPETTLSNDLIKLINRGDLFGCSFQMFVEKESWDYDATPAKRIIQSAYIDEISIVGQPAYKVTNIEVIE